MTKDSADISTMVNYGKLISMQRTVSKKHEQMK